MKLLFVATAALTMVVTGSAAAADMPIKTPAPRVISDWTGFYFGFHGGYGWGRAAIADADLNDPDQVRRNTVVHAPKIKGSLFGGHAGYNWQWGQRGVIGVEVDYSATGLKQTQAANGSFSRLVGQEDDPSSVSKEFDSRTLKAKLDRLASARARAGFLISPEFLLYGTGGVAWGHTKFTDTLNVRSVDPGLPDEIDILVSQARANHFGWVAGAGTEWKLWDSLMFRVEYLHYDFGSTSLAFNTTMNGTINFGSFDMQLNKLTANVVRGGISYKF